MYVYKYRYIDTGCVQTFVIKEEILGKKYLHQYAQGAIRFFFYHESQVILRRFMQIMQTQIDN